MVFLQYGNQLQLVTPRFSSRPINFFSFYINGVPQGLNTDVKLFADDTPLFSVVNNVSVSVSSLNNDLIKIRDWDFSWKMPFNTDPTKQVKEAAFSTKKKNSLYSLFHNSKTSWFNVRPENNISISCKQKN